ncbi:betaine/carnitine transporter, BCCT family [Lentibacillus persicus]|uniref:Betaine/carnitine transporter, BCCT family n=1 Tax=Lentibacillus persicus TaxID=640948 RepID=A0A1I1YXF3_9BACI|nr:BCCT family transporter [Lentibacillus persicus]SFE24149.1 betaine/carnitine transporter, BCCT family [Lentibacillus persicus]
MKDLNVEHKVLWPVLLILLAGLVPVGLNPSAAADVVGTILSFITGNFGWIFVLFPFMILIFFSWLVFGRFGQIKLGDPDSKPEFSNFSWFAMIFTTGIGAEIMYQSVIEPITYTTGPPFGLEPGTIGAAEWAIPYGFFHWGILAWAIYALPSIPMAYALYVKKVPYFRLSAACKPILGKHSEGLPGKIVDVAMMIGLIGVVGTSIGLVAPMIAELLSEMFNIPVTLGLMVIVIALWVAIFGGSVYLGLEKGIKRLSNFNIVIVAAITAFVFLVGPTIFMLNNSIQGLGRMFNDFFEMGLNLGTISGGSFPQDWTVFYWAWWIGYASLIGLFTARISKGRTIKQVIITQCLIGPVGCWVFFGVFGNYALNIQMSNLIPVDSMMAESGQTGVIMAVINTLPLSAIIIPLLVIAYLIFSATTFDTASLILSSVASKKLDKTGQPPRLYRLFWALILGGVGIVILVIGGLQAVQLSSVIVGVPMILVFVLMTISFIKSVKEDFGEEKSTLVRYSEIPASETQGNQMSADNEDVLLKKDET